MCLCAAVNGTDTEVQRHMHTVMLVKHTIKPLSKTDCYSFFSNQQPTTHCKIPGTSTHHAALWATHMLLDTHTYMYPTSNTVYWFTPCEHYKHNTAIQSSC